MSILKGTYRVADYEHGKKLKGDPWKTNFFSEAFYISKIQLRFEIFLKSVDFTIYAFLINKKLKFLNLRPNNHKASL